MTNGAHETIQSAPECKAQKRDGAMQQREYEHKKKSVRRDLDACPQINGQYGNFQVEDGDKNDHFKNIQLSHPQNKISVSRSGTFNVYF